MIWIQIIQVGQVFHTCMPDSRLSSIGIKSMCFGMTGFVFDSMNIVTILLLESQHSSGLLSCIPPSFLEVYTWSLPLLFFLFFIWLLSSLFVWNSLFCLFLLKPSFPLNTLFWSQTMCYHCSWGLCADPCAWFETVCVHPARAQHRPEHIHPRH